MGIPPKIVLIVLADRNGVVTNSLDYKRFSVDQKLVAILFVNRNGGNFGTPGVLGVNVKTHNTHAKKDENDRKFFQKIILMADEHQNTRASEKAKRLVSWELVR